MPRFIADPPADPIDKSDEREVTLALFGLLSRPGDLRELLSDVTRLMHHWSGCQAVGIRLRQGEDFPYFETSGFPPQFVQAENSLCARTADGALIRDYQGNPVLECMCGNVICGRFDASLPFFTENGSFWTNSTTELLTSTTEQDRQARTRNRCHGEGFESVALIPLRCTDQTFGLLQFNDSRPGRFTPAVIGLLERLASSVAIVIDQRQQNEAALRHSHELMHYIIAHSRSAVAVHDKDLKYIYVSQRYLDDYNVKEKDVIGKHHYEVFPDLPQKWRDVHQRALAGEILSAEDDPYEREDGTVEWTRWECRPWYQADGAIGGIIVYTELITERKRIETSLAESSRRLNEVIRAANVGLWDWDLTTNQVHYSAEWKRQIGYEDHEIGNSAEEWFSRVHPEDLQPTLDRIQQAISDTRQHYQVEFRFRRKDGSYRWILAQSSVYCDEAGKPARMLGSHIDITDRKTAEQALRESEEKYRTILQNMDDPTYISSSDYRIEYTNPAMMKWIGHDATGKNCFKSLWGRDHTCPWCVLDKVIAGQTVKDERIGPDGKRRYSVSSSPIVRPDGSVAKLAVYRDVTGIRNMEARIQHAQKMESIGALAGGIAHDFNNILFPIIGLSEMLLEDLPPASQEHENVAQILIAARRAGDLVKQILSFSRQVEHKKIPMRIQSVLKEVVKLAHATIPSNIAIDQDIHPKCGMVLADPTQLHQVAMNLITNAFHAVEQAGGKIAIGLKQADLAEAETAGTALTPGTYAVLTIGDTGHGIDPAVMDKIFEPYFTTKEQGKGTGLGLATVFGIVKDHGGDIRVNSQVGKGATFTVYLPVLTEAGQTAASPSIDQPRRGTETILLVDDEASIVNMQRRSLERLGYKVIAHTGSVAALKAFRAAPLAFDLVITDMAMPELTGDNLARELIAIRPDIPVIICTGFSERIDEDRATSLGIKALVLKPVVMSELTAQIRRILDEACADSKK